VDVTHDANWLFNLHQIGLLFEYFEGAVEQLLDLSFVDGAFSANEFFKQLPVRHSLRLPELLVSQLLVRHHGAVFVLERPISERVGQERKLHCG
jgi:hypothetical protein